MSRYYSCIRRIIIVLVIIQLRFLFCAYGQHQPGTAIHIKRAKSPIVLDGILDEQDWNIADTANDFFLNYPTDTVRATYQTEVRMTFDEHLLYLAFIAHDDSLPNLINSLRRDFDYELNDHVGVSIGPYNDRINGFYFAVTPRGVQEEGTVMNGGSASDSFNSYWDNKWYSKSTRYPDKWIVEMAIPFRSIRYKGNSNEWNIAFYRQDKKHNQKSAWIRTPIQYNPGAFAYCGQLIWDDPIPPPHPNFSVIPFVAGGYSGDNSTGSEAIDIQTGFDAKIGVTPSLNADITVNPDFSQIEVDQQVINLTRFEFKFPERRQFFLENSDLSDQAGFIASRAFFSRRIGLVADSTGSYSRVPIAYGLRLSGSINRKWRINTMNMQTKKKVSLGLPAQNYTVASLQRNVGKQSSIAVTYVDKRSLKVAEGDSLLYFHEDIFLKQNGSSAFKKNTWNKVINLDLEMLSAANRWYHSSYLSQSFDQFNKTQNFSGGGFIQYAGRQLTASTWACYIGKNYNAESGFVPTHGVYPGQLNINSSVGYKFYPDNSSLVSMGPQWISTQTYLPNGTLTDRNYALNYTFNFRNTALFELTGTYIFQQLTSDFSPLDKSRFQSFNKDERYSWSTITAGFQSDTRKTINYALQSAYGGFYNGTGFDIKGQLNARLQPYGNVALRFDYNNVRLPANYGQARLIFVGPRFDVTFTDRLFLTTNVQYNTLLDNVNLNARFQWRYKPASDFFIVYTENYLPEFLSSKNRSLVFKITYWFNL